MVGARRAHRVGGDHVPFGVRGVAEAREAAVEHRRQGGGRRGEERGRKVRARRTAAPPCPVVPDRLGIRRKGMTRFPGTARVRKGASARISSIDSRTNGTLFVTCAPVDVVGPDPTESPEPATARRITATGTILRRKGRAARLSWEYLRGFILSSLVAVVAQLRRFFDVDDSIDFQQLRESRHRAGDDPVRAGLGDDAESGGDDLPLLRGSADVHEPKQQVHVAVFGPRAEAGEQIELQRRVEAGPGALAVRSRPPFAGKDP